MFELAGQNKSAGWLFGGAEDQCEARPDDLDEAPATARAGGLLPAGGLASVMLVVGIGAVLVPAMTAGDDIDGLLGWCFSVLEG